MLFIKLFRCIFSYMHDAQHDISRRFLWILVFPVALREIQGIPGSFSSCCVCECNSQNTPTDVSLIWIYETDLANIESVHLNACWMRAEQPHGACRVLAPDVIHSHSDNYFSGAKKTAVTSESLISVCSHFQPLNRSCEINIYMSQIPVKRAMYVF